MKSRQRRTSEDIRGVKRGDKDESIFAWPTGRGEKLETAIRVGDFDLPERRKRYTSKRVEEEKDKLNCPCGKAKESRTHVVAKLSLIHI